MMRETMSDSPIANREIADVLERVAELLDAQGANRFRVRAYRAAAETIRRHDEPLARILREGGREAVDALPTLGPTMAAHVAELVERGSLGLLARLEGEVSGEALLSTLPGIGPELAARIHEDLAIDSLEELELAAHDGRLEGVRGFGPRRVRAVRESLAATLGRSTRNRSRRLARRERAAADALTSETPARPSAASLLAVDADYRARAEAGELRRIAPRRFNPEGRAWLPILHTEKEGWHLTALFSNTARAHELKKTHDWVVIFYERNGDEGQCTVVSVPRGALAGRRVIRGREPECEEHHAQRADRTTSRSAPAHRSASTASKGAAT
jgi:hypothetical protein